MTDEQTGGGEELSNRTNLMLKFFLLLASTGFSLVAAEFVLRTFGLAPAVTHTRWADHVQVVEGPEFRYYERNNSIGVRDSREFLRESRSTRVLFIGDSFTFGNGVSNDDTISAKVEAILNEETGKSWSIINAGQPGTGTRAEELNLKRLLGLIDVNAVVLFYFVDNDPYETQQEYGSEGGASQVYRSEPRALRLKAALMQHSALYRFLYLRLATVGTVRAFPYTIFDQCDPAKVETFRQMDSLMRASVDGMEELAREKNLVFLVAMIPRREQLSDQAFDAFKRSYHVSRYPYDRFLPQRRVMKNVFGPEGISPLNLLNLLEGSDPDKYYYRLDGHFNSEGTSFVAKQIANLILGSVRQTEVIEKQKAR